jgi:circadian clock protein KaiC
MVKKKKSVSKKSSKRKVAKRKSVSSKKVKSVSSNVPVKKSGKLVRVKTGVPKLDPLIQGGLKENSINLVVGDAGSGKTIFAMHFLMQGLKEGESCLYITFEEKKEKLYEDMSSFKWDFGKFEEQKKFFYLEYSPEQVKSLIEEGGGTVDQLISKRKITRLVIDSATSFSLLYQDELTRKEAGLALFKLINKLGCTAVLTSQGTFKDGRLQATSMEFEADSIMLLYHIRQNGLRQRAIEVLKMRGTKHTNKSMSFTIDSSGLRISPGKLFRLNL